MNTIKGIKEIVIQILQNITDPEIPVISILDLGIVTNIIVENTDSNLENVIGTIYITPTYSGCPAMSAIKNLVTFSLLEKGLKKIKVEEILSPTWTTDWMSEAGKNNLKAYGIAPPVGKSINEELIENLVVTCPQCNSNDTKLISQFGSTSCKALFKCNQCLEPFDYFKCH